MGDSLKDTTIPGNYPVTRRRIVLSVSLFLAVLLMLSAWHAWNGFKVAINNAELQSQSYARALKEHAERAFSEADQVLLACILEIQGEGGINSVNHNELTRILKLHNGKIPHISAITIIGDDGIVRATSFADIKKLPDASGRSYFRYHRDNPSSQVLLSPPVQSLANKQWGFILSRRMQGKSGKFAGVALIFFDLHYFEQLYSSIVSNRNGRFSLATCSGDYLVLVPPDEKVYASGKKTATFFRSYVQEQPVRTYHNPSSNIAGEYRIISYHKLDNYPVVAISSFARNEAIADWQSITLKQGVITILLCLLVIMLTRFLLSHIRLLDLTNQRLQQQKEELKVAEESAMAATRAKSQFLANMSHEIRTPMNAIIALTHLTLDSELQPQQREYLQRLKYSSDNMMGIINDILDFSKIEAQMLTLEKQRVDLLNLVQQSVDLFKVSATLKGLQLQLLHSCPLPSNISADPVRLAQVLNNLIGNAVKFTEEGSVTVSFELLEELSDKVWVRFSVADTGIGIENSMINQMFQPFSQADGSIVRRFGGTGLGLAIAGSLVELMEGTISVTSTPGTGSTFTFTVPFDRISHADVVAEKPQIPISEIASSIRGSHILLVEDNEANQFVASKLLVRAGLTVDIANNGSEALEMLQKSSFDLVLMDMQMPVMDGIQATRLIREIPLFKELPVIAMTAAATESDRNNCLEAGMNDYISKPIVVAELFEKLIGWIKKPASQGS